MTTDGKAVPGLFTLRKTGLSNEGMKRAAEAWLDSVDPGQRDAALFSVDSDAWRRWSNIHAFLMRHGAMMEPMTQDQRDLAFGLLREGFSPSGFELARNIMKLNDSIREITGSDEELGEWLYWLSVLGEPSLDEPWGWQFDGHHLNVNCFLLGGQMVMTPMFMGSEPVAVDIGKHAGTRVFQAEGGTALNLALTLSAKQRSKAIVTDEVPSGIFTGAFRDNFEMRHEGIKLDDLSSHQQTLMFDLIGTYINRMRSDHAQLKMDEIRQHLDETHFAWMGGTDEDSVFYYRVHSPVILIEFDHQMVSSWTTTNPREIISTPWCGLLTATTTAGTCCGNTGNRSTTTAISGCRLHSRCILTALKYRGFGQLVETPVFLGDTGGGRS